MWFCLVCTYPSGARIDLRLKRKMTLKDFGDSYFRCVREVYGQSGLQLKDEADNTFAGYQMEWNGAFSTSAIVQRFPMCDNKFQDVVSFVPRQMKTAICYGWIVSFFDRATILDEWLQIQL